MSDAKCIACGMPLKGNQDWGNADKDYCKYCSRPDGTMQSYEEKLESMSKFIVRTQGLNADAAKELAARRLEGLPAWADREKASE